ncbi:MAG TPA: YebC/PmpR family DNA-binding transcriptional regulator [Patescibacteria group bacterium]|nr:YebC/PmpR family DNA-binding transcriptional regulator [Patescibacteria group bacterium]
MSGHSKWSQIKRQKGAADIKRGALFSRLTNAIILAARSGGDPSANFPLKIAIEKARAANMPKENIERAIKRGTGELGGTKIEEVLYEAIGPENIGLIIQALSDNRNRTNSEVKNVLTQFGGKLVGLGAVKYQFERMGKMLIDLAEFDREDLELKVIDAGARDFEEEDDSLAIYTQPNELKIVKEKLENQSIPVREAALTWEPKNLVSISDQSQAKKILVLMEGLENIEEVTGVYANFDLSTPLGAGIEKELA